MKASAILALVLCLQAALAADSKHLNFESLRTIIPGSTTQKQVLEKFGPADKIIDLKTLHRSTDNGISWEYREGDGTRLSIAFEVPGQITSGWTWTVSSKDPENDLKTAMGRFAGAAWESETVKWVNPHQVPMECFFRDNTRGISITFNRVHKEVDSISRWNPSRKLSSTENNEKPPRFCFEDNCTDAKLSKEVFKDHPLCEIPK